MKRRASERELSTEDLASKQRIVHRKHRTPSPNLDKVMTKSHREVQTSSGGVGITTLSGSGGLYTSKYANKYEQRSHKADSQIREERPTIVDSNATRTLFVGNLKFDITERELCDLFGVYGPIEDVDMKSQRQTCPAYAFVHFFNINDAIAAKNDMNGRHYGSYRMKIGFGKGNPSIKVWIGNISCDADLTEIRQELDHFGFVRKVEYIKGDNHAIVRFDKMDAAQTAVNSLQDYRFRSTNRPLKINILSKSLTSRGSEFDDLEVKVHNTECVSDRETNTQPSFHAKEESLQEGILKGGCTCE